MGKFIRLVAFKATTTRGVILGFLLLTIGVLHPQLGLAESFATIFLLWSSIELLKTLLLALKLVFLPRTNRASIIQLDSWPFEEATYWSEFRDHILSRQSTRLGRFLQSIDKPSLVALGISFLFSLIILAWMLYNELTLVSSIIFAVDIVVLSISLEAFYHQSLIARVQQLSTTQFALSQGDLAQVP